MSDDHARLLVKLQYYYDYIKKIEKEMQVHAIECEKESIRDELQIRCVLFSDVTQEFELLFAKQLYAGDDNE